MFLNKNDKILLVAEISANHNGDLQIAKKLVCVLIQKTSIGGGSSPYKQIMNNSRFTIETLSQMKFQALIQGFQPRNSSCLTC